MSSTTGDRTITLQCSVAANYWDWIYGTGETGYWYPGGGMQWDFEEQVHLTVLPREGNSEAYLRLFTNEGLTNEITNNTPIGGTVYPTLYVKIGPGERVKGGTSTVTVRVHDLYDNYDPGTTVDFDTQVDMVSATGWQVEQPDHSWIDATCGPAAIDNKEGADPILYRRKLTWDTTSLPTKGNGLHAIGTTAKVGFEEWVVNEGWTNDYECGPWTLKPDVENLYIGDRTGNGVYITGVKVTEGTIDYFKWDPDAAPPLSTPKIEFKIRDADPGDRYECIVYYRSTSGARTWGDGPHWAATKTIDQNISTSIPVTIELADPSVPGHLDPAVHGWGTYTFDVVVVEYKGGVQVDRYALKEPYCLWVPSETPETPARPGHTWWVQMPTGSGADELRVAYWLNDQCQRDAADTSVTTVDPFLHERKTVSVPTGLELMHGGTDANEDGQMDGVCAYLFALGDAGGVWRVIWTGTDACGPHTPHRRTHDGQRMLAANGAEDISGPGFTVQVEEDWMVRTDDQRALRTNASSCVFMAPFEDCGKKLRRLHYGSGRVPYRQFIPTRNERITYSKDHFWWYDHRAKGFMHLIGADRMEPNATVSGYSGALERYCYVFVGQLECDPEAIMISAIHETGHQFATPDHEDPENWPRTHLGGYCAMCSAMASIGIDPWFCTNCKLRIRLYRWR